MNDRRIPAAEYIEDLSTFTDNQLALAWADNFALATSKGVFDARLMTGNTAAEIGRRTETVRNAKSTYQLRHCAFVDILGFKGILNRLSSQPDYYKEVRAVLKIVSSARPKILDVRPYDDDLRSQTISDAIAVSTLVESSRGLPQLFNTLGFLCIDLLRLGYLLRGAIVKGELYHDDQVVFGNGLVKAHDLERDEVDFPRIMILDDVRVDAVTLSRGGSDGGATITQIAKAHDGSYFLDVLKFVTSPSAGQSEAGHLADVTKMRDNIQTIVVNSASNQRHSEINQWFAAYWNHTMKPLDLPIVEVDGIDLSGIATKVDE